MSIGKISHKIELNRRSGIGLSRGVHVCKCQFSKVLIWVERPALFQSLIKIRYLNQAYSARSCSFRIHISSANQDQIPIPESDSQQTSFLLALVVHQFRRATELQPASIAGKRPSSDVRKPYGMHRSGLIYRLVFSMLLTQTQLSYPHSRFGDEPGITLGQA